ncbi:MAG: hypothetical protein FWD42_09565 [Solirubrobacterales bacterium]|nr:hypothetical protein [Solirubrobacterales bacterium]
MPTLVMDAAPAEWVALVERRRALELDRWDEVWEGVRHVNPPPSREQARIAGLLHRLTMRRPRSSSSTPHTR